jgi:hypothetical protein
MCQKLE